ncbi:hypothetical protein HKI87_16g83500 [Chloropicon roscoffensis]|uniref:Uncharacterized protein n=1 Tax=Chloropicon roscoffensis TaxID=1461544 RepID=A0AAX4PL91_9CHLO
MSESCRAYNKTARGKKKIQEHGQKVRNYLKTEAGKKQIQKHKQEHGQKMRNWWKTEDGMKVKKKLRARPRWAENKNVYGAHAPPSPEKCAHAFHRDGLSLGEATLVVNLNTVWNQPTLCHFVSAGDGQLPSLSFNLLHGDTLMFGSFVDERYLHGVPARHPDFCSSTRVSIAVTVKKVGTLALQEIVRLMLDGKYTRCTRWANVQTSRAVIVLRGEGEEMRSLPTKDQEEEGGFCEEDFFSRAPAATWIIQKIARDMGGVWTRAQVNVYPSHELALKMSKAAQKMSKASSSASSASS